MANRKISQFITTTDITTVQGLAGYDATTNVQISGSALITSLEANLYKPFGNNGDVLTIVAGVPAWAPGGGPGGNATMQDVYNNSVASTPNQIVAVDNTADLQLTNAEIGFTSGGKGKFESDSTLTLESIGDEAILKGDAGVKVVSGTGVTLESDSGNNQYSFAFDVNGAIQLDGISGNTNEVILSNGAGNQAEWGKVELSGVNSSVSGVLGIANGGTGITQYGEACEVFLDTDNIGGTTLGNSNDDTTYVAPFSATAFNDSAAIYTPTFNTGTGSAANWNGGIQVLVSGKYLVEGQYFSQDGQNSGAQMEVWAEVTTTNNPHSASWPTTATAGDIYLLGNGRTSSTLSGNAGQTGSRIITISAGDYVRILFRHADFPGQGFPSWQDNFNGPVNGLEGYRPRLTITRIA